MNKHLNKMFSVVTILALMLMALPMQSAGAAPSFFANPTSTVFINEIHYDNTGTDAGEAIEIAGPAGTDLTGWSIVLYNGSGGASYNTAALSGTIPNLGGGFGVVVVNYPSNGIQNGSPDGIALIDAVSNVVQFLSYEGAFTAVGDAANGILSTDIGMSESGSGAVGNSLQLTGSGTTYGDFIWAAEQTNTFGAANTGQSFGGTTAEPKINEIQVSTSSTDWEFFELQGSPATDLSSLTLIGIESDTGTSAGTIDRVINLTGQSIPSDGFWLGISPAGATAYGVTGELSIPNDSFENSTATYFLVSGFAGAQGADLDTDNNGVLDSTPWDAVLDSVNIRDSASDFTYGAPAVGPDGTFLPSGTFRCPDAPVGSFDNNIHNFSVPDGTPGGANNCLPPIVINEIDYDQPSTDTAEFVEIRNNGSTAVSLSGWTLELVNGSGGGAAVYDTIALPAVSLEAGDYFVVCANAAIVPNCDLDDSPDTNFIQNGPPDAVGLRFNGNLVDAVSYGGNTGAPYTEGSGIGLADSTASGQSISRCPDGADTNVNNVDFGLAGSTPGAANDCAPPPPQLTCDGTYTFTSIHDIQGSGASTSMSGQEVIIEGVVVGDFQANDSDAGDLAGFYVQEENSQADDQSSTSEGIFVFDLGSSVDVKAGDVVRVLGNVNEFQNQTQVNAGAVVVCGSGQSALVSPTAIPFPLPNGQADLEQYEGMLVTVNQPLTVIEYFNLDRYGTVDVATERLETPTDAAEPGAASDAVLAFNNARRIRLDDGSQTQNPFPVTLPDGQLEYSDAFGGGDTLSNIVGVLSWIRPWTGGQPEGYAIQLTQLPTFENTNPRPADAPDVGGSFKAVGFNVLNYFNGDGMGGGFPTSRGATDPAEFQKQTTKIVAALVELDADVVGLIEIENDFADGTNSAIADLVDALNAATAPGTYVYINPGVNVGTDEITVAIIYKPATAAPVGDLAILDSQDFVNPFNADIDRNRPALAQTFMSVESGGVLTVVVNHLKSKGSGCGAGDDDPRQGSCNATREASAQVLVDWLATDPTGSKDADYLLIGDYNSYAKEDPIDVFTDAGYVDLFALFQPDDVYSYVFDGMTGYLDYGIASATLVPQVTGAAPWNINSDEPDAFEYDELFDHPSNLPLWYAPTAYRSSDHDPVVVGLDLLHYDFTGFFHPIDNAPTVNSVKAGQAVPIKFSLGGDQGLDIFFDGYPKFEFGSCDSSSTDPVEETLTSSNSGLFYDSATDQYTYVWKTEKNWSGKCGTLTIVFDDGSIHNILFKFTK